MTRLFLIGDGEDPDAGNLTAPARSGAGQPATAPLNPAPEPPPGGQSHGCGPLAVGHRRARHLRSMSRQRPRGCSRDVGARNNLARLGLEPPLDYAAVKRAVSRWQPYVGMVYFHLVLDHLEAVGELGRGEAALSR